MTVNSIILPPSLPPTLAVIVSALAPASASRIVERLTAKDDGGRYLHTAERVTAELSLAGFRVSASTLRTWRRRIDFQESVTA
jgi:hypothetical protein